MKRRDLLKMAAATPALMALSGPAFAQEDRVLNAIMRDATPDIYPYGNSQRSGLVIAHHVWDALLHRNSETFEHEPLLAESWEWIDDLTIEFKLRQGVTWHNGDPFTADDVVYTIETIAGPDAKVAVPSNVSWMDHAEKIDDFTVRLLLKSPLPAALDYLTLTTPMLPKKYREEVGADEYSKNPIGCGPYKVTKLSAGAQIVMEAYDGYYEGSPKGKPAIKTINLRFVPDPTTEQTELLSGGADWAWKITVDQFDNFSRVPQFTTVAQPTMRVNYMTIDAAGRTGEGNPLTELKVRQAICHAIDRETLAKQLIGKDALIPDSPCFADQLGCEIPGAFYPYDPEKAKALLAEAGYPDGFETTLVTYQPADVVASIQAYLADVGIKLNIDRLAVAAAIEKSHAGEAPLYCASWGSYSIMDVSAILPVLFGGRADDYARDPDVMAWIEEGGSTSDTETRVTSYAKALKKISEDALIVPLYYSIVNFAFVKELNFKTQADELPRFYEASWA